MRMTLMAVTMATLALACAHPAKAEITYPWCAESDDGEGQRNCGFATLDQCRAAVIGNGGYCLENPLYGASASALPGARETTGSIRGSKQRGNQPR